MTPRIKCKHTTLKRDCPACQALAEKWNDKLEASGLENIEQEDGNLKLWSSHFFKSRFNATIFSAKEEYYRVAGHFLHDYPFKNRVSREVWKLHSEGMGMKNILPSIKKMRLKVNAKQISELINQFSEMMMTQWQKKI